MFSEAGIVLLVPLSTDSSQARWLQNREAAVCPNPTVVQTQDGPASPTPGRPSSPATPSSFPVNGVDNGG